MDFAEAVTMLNDEVSSCTARAEVRGLTKEEIAAELRRIADEIEKE